MSATVSVNNKDLEENISDCESITDSEKDDYSSEGSIGERLRGDGQEHDIVLNKKVDDDEDRRNPQYIPKRGNFYEHDDRTLEEDENSATENNEASDKVEKDTPRSRKKVWEEKDGEKWGHDLYIEKEQQPKTKQELINAYGYDIRNEDGPPRARRRRRYGRGPNKYTRNWEDEEAYNRSANARIRKNPKNPPTQEDFPPLNTDDHLGQYRSPTKIRSNRIQNKNQFSNDAANNDFGSMSSQRKKDRAPLSHSPPNIQQKLDKTLKKGKNIEKQRERGVDNNVNDDKTLQYNQIQKDPSQQMLNTEKSTKIQKSSRSKTDEYQKVVKTSKNSLSNSGSSSSKLTKYKTDEMQQTKIQPITSQSYINRNKIPPPPSCSLNQMEDAECEMYETVATRTGMNSFRDNTIENTNNMNNRQASIPPRLQQTSEQQRAGPKRYSSLRQRSLPETTPQSYNTGYYQQEFTPQSQTTEPHSIHQSMQMSPNAAAAAALLTPMPSQNQPIGLSLSGHSNSTGQMCANQQTPGSSVSATQQSQHGQSQILNAAAAQSMLAAHMPQTQVSVHHQQLINAAAQAAAQQTPIITHALAQSAAAAHQSSILTQAPPPPQGLSPQTHHAMLNAAQSQQLLTAQTHNQYGGPPPNQYQVPSGTGNPNTVYNLQQTVTANTAAFIQPQPTAVINPVYGSAPPGSQPPQYTATPFPAYQAAYSGPTGQTTQDLYQSQSGITYYSPHNQPAAPRAPLKRPKAAIPILAPPERLSTTPPRGRGRISPPNDVNVNNNVGMSNENNPKTEHNSAMSPIEVMPNNQGNSPSEKDSNGFLSRGRGRKTSNETINNTDLELVIENKSEKLSIDLKCIENAIDDLSLNNKNNLVVDKNNSLESVATNKIQENSNCKTLVVESNKTSMPVDVSPQDFEQGTN